MNLKNIFLVVIWSVLLAPSLLFFCGTNQWGKTEEKAAPIVFNPKKPFEYFDTYYKNNFAFRNVLSKQYLRLKNKYGNTSPIPDKVVFGKNGWYYLGNSYDKTYSESIGAKNYTDKEISEIAKKVIEMKQFCDSQNIKFYFIPTPNTATIYPEYLPVKANKKIRRFDLVKEKLNGKVNFIDIRNQLFEAKKQGQIYYKTDSHWNEKGAYIGALSISKEINKDFAEASILNKNIFNVQENFVNQMDLTLMLNKYEIEKIYTHTEKNIVDLQEKFDTIDKIPYQFYSRPSKKLKGYFYRDSYSIGMIPFLKTLYKNSTFVQSSSFNKSIIAKEKPDFVVYQIVERDLEFSIKIN